MTTEVGSETEVKEEAEESSAQTDQSEKAPGETQEAAEAEEKEREKEGKGITRYLPTWLKKQKSPSQASPRLDITSPAKEVPPTEDAQEDAAPAVNGHAEEDEESVKAEEPEAEPRTGQRSDTEVRVRGQTPRYGSEVRLRGTGQRSDTEVRVRGRGRQQYTDVTTEG
ncbi:hypothetical protein EYF80_066155 [Liparis tanakae]|uniref:Band 4.1-like protein 2 n=1 Tax=Liparis tanakae TaxID=230148 RepID=A0A4Z2E4W0_9TELE|nr:hypothetical protein EYF80_066155 [Liparis tanakae]